MPITSETVTLAGSGLVFENTYKSDVTDAYRASILTAENYLQSHFSNAVTINATWETRSLAAYGSAASNGYSFIPTTYSNLVAALRSHATTSDDLIAVNSLPLSDPSGGQLFRVPRAEGEILGFDGGAPPLYDVDVEISTDLTWSFGQDVVGVLLHELSEGAFGRMGMLGVGGFYGSTDWGVMDLFRFTADGVRDYTGGRDGIATFFGLDAAHVSTLQFHGSIGADGVFDNADLADWKNFTGDAFGPSAAGSPGQMSATDLQILDILGWTPRSPGQVVNPGDDLASSFADLSHPMGQLAVGGRATGALEVAGDRDWFKMTLQPGDYLVSESGASGGGGSLVDPFLRVYDSTGVLVRQADDIVPGQDLDARLILHVSAPETFYLEAGAGLDHGAGSYSVGVQVGTVASTAGADMLFGQIGGSTITAGAGDDLIVGRDAPNYLRGEDGNDSVQGGAAFDDINGNTGNDTCHGGEGDDWVVGGKDDDQLFGDDGNDIVYGNLGNDTCDGGSGNDLIRGGQGNDSLAGGAGDDWLSGDRGNDTISGGAGADTFHTFNGAGVDIVTDFNSAEGDRVQLDPGATYTLKQVGLDAVVDMGNGDQLILKNVTLAGLPNGWIFGA